jgi:acyl carrier protein
MSSLAELQALIQEKYGIDTAMLDPNASMRAAGVDSLALVEFLFEVEDRLGLKLPEADPSMDTLAQLAELVDSARAAAAQKQAA